MYTGERISHSPEKYDTSLYSDPFWEIMTGRWIILRSFGSKLSNDLKVKKGDVEKSEDPTERSTLKPSINGKSYDFGGWVGQWWIGEQRKLCVEEDWRVGVKKGLIWWWCTNSPELGRFRSYRTWAVIRGGLQINHSAVNGLAA